MSRRAVAVAVAAAAAARNRAGRKQSGRRIAPAPFLFVLAMAQFRDWPEMIRLLRSAFSVAPVGRPDRSTEGVFMMVL